MELYRQKYYGQLNNVDGVMVSCTPLYNQMNCDHDFEMPVMVQVISGKLPNNYPRKSINLCIVLDRSGSMRNAIQSCKNAVESIIDKLNEDDLISLVVYDDNVDIIFNNCSVKDKTHMIAKLQSVTERGSTDIYMGVSRSIDVLLNKQTKLTDNDTTNTDVDSNDKTKILFLFSDGLANSGNVNGEEIGKMIYHKSNDIFVSTFGIGDEYDDILMSSIAYCGKGNYFYIQNPNEIPQIVERGLNGLTKYWTKNAKIELSPEDGVLIIDKHELPEILSVREYALHRYLIKAKCSKETAKINVTLTYTDGEGNNRTKFVECVWNYSKEPKIDLVSNKQVRCYTVIRQCSELNKVVMQLMDNPSFNSKQILELKNRIIELYQGVVNDDEYGIIAALLKKEKDASNVMTTQGCDSLAASKSIGYTSLSSGNKIKMYSYCQKVNENATEQDDIGFNAFS